MFRLVIPLAAGIFFADTFRLEIGEWPVTLMLSLLVLLGVLLKVSPYRWRWMFGAGVGVFLFLTGWMLVGHAWNRVKVDWPSESLVYRGVLKDSPIAKANSYRCHADVSGKDVWLYFPKDSLSASLRVGDGILFRARIASPSNKDSLQTFDYARYLYHHGISGTGFVSSMAWEKVEVADKNLKREALGIRERILEKYKEWGINEEVFPVLSALTLGYKGELDKDTRESYSAAGISHVLALSGMHVGIVWLLLDGMLSLLMRKRLKWLKCCLVVAALWMFAFVVGLEASVVRAVVMCMLMGLGSLSGSRPLSMNTLAIAALCMLLYHPFYLFDVSFQLSFVAVASIWLFYPVFSEGLFVKNRLGRRLWGVMSVSMAAQLGPAPLVMYYFSGISVWFVLANLVVALLVPFIIGGSILMVVMAPFAGIQVYVVQGLNLLVAGLNLVADYTARLPFATWAVDGMEVVEVVACYVVLAFGWMLWKTRIRRWLIRLLGAVACLLAFHLFVLMKNVFFG